jgi:hypothetical protein
MYELGDGSLTAEELTRIREVLQAEAECLHAISSKIHLERRLELGSTERP